MPNTAVAQVHIDFKIRLERIDSFGVALIVVAKDAQAVDVTLEHIGNEMGVPLRVGPADAVLEDVAVDDDAPLVEVVPGFDFHLGSMARTRSVQSVSMVRT